MIGWAYLFSLYGAYGYLCVILLILEEESEERCDAFVGERSRTMHLNICQRSCKEESGYRRGSYNSSDDCIKDLSSVSAFQTLLKAYEGLS